MIGRGHSAATGRTPSGRPPEVVVAELLAAQQTRFASLDPGLPPAMAPPPGDVVVVAGGATGEAAGVITHHYWPEGSAPLLWSAAEVSELYPVLGASGPAGTHALIAAWRERIAPRVRRERDSAAVVSWPSHDVAATRVFLDHGLAPLAVLAVRPLAPPPPVEPTVHVRRAGPEDLEDCLRLAMEEIVYSSQVGGSVLRADAETIKRTTLRARLGRGEPTWVAERGGAVVGMLECGRAEASPGTWLAGLLPEGPWGYVNCAAVRAAERGAGIGRAMVAAALPVLQADGARGTYLYYNPPNPVSSVFWPRQGYRPLWTLWETRPAASLR